MALSFTNGSTHYVDFTSAAAFDSYTALSILMLVKPATLNAGAVLMAKKVNAGTGLGWSLELSGTSGAMLFRRRYTTNATNYTSGTGVLATDTWAWVAATWDEAAAASAKVHLYSGAYAGSLAETSYASQTDGTPGGSDDLNSLKIGNTDALATSVTFGGVVEYAVLYSAAVSMANLQAAVNSISTTGTNSYTTNRTGEWKLGWGGGTTVPDQSGGGRDGTATGASNAAGILEYRAARMGAVQYLLSG